ncbi:MAG: hypothetical protein PVJ57_21710 [Phycisphaerae bacterium]|jgi:hypothetical protein
MARKWWRRIGVVSAVVALGMVGLAVRSYVVFDSVDWGWGGGYEWSIYAAAGELAFCDRTNPRHDEPGLHLRSETANDYRLREEFDGMFLGLSVETGTYHYRDGGAIRVRRVLVPLTGMAVVAVAASAGLLFVAYRKPAGMSGLLVCKTCGYNLTGNVSGRCPECGTAVESAGAKPPADVYAGKVGEA